MSFALYQTRRLFFFSLLALMSCSNSNDVKPENYQGQREFFINAIQKVQQAGAILQKTSLTETSIEKAMLLLDDSMKAANTVDASFLKWIDSGLYQAFSGYLTKGIENYRLGFVYEDKKQQALGIEQLQKWWHFWQLKKPAILEKLDATL